MDCSCCYGEKNSTSDVFTAEKPLSFIVIPINVAQVAVDVVIMECM